MYKRAVRDTERRDGIRADVGACTGRLVRPWCAALADTEMPYTAVRVLYLCMLCSYVHVSRVVSGPVLLAAAVVARGAACGSR